MADRTKKYPENVKGRYYVDRECIACDACVLAAPDHFGMHQDDGHAFVMKQPANSTEEDLCREAMEGCPVEAIGNNGELGAEGGTANPPHAGSPSVAQGATGASGGTASAPNAAAAASAQGVGSVATAQSALYQTPLANKK